MAKVIFEVDCNDKSCLKCHFEKLNYSRGKSLCSIYRKLLEYDGEGSVFRLPECTAAEVPPWFNVQAYKDLKFLQECYREYKPLTKEEVDELIAAVESRAAEVKE
jgi:hypothetical protein